MSLARPLRDPLDAARSMIARANIIDADLQAGKAQAMLANARANFVENGTIADAFLAAAERIEALRLGRSRSAARASALGAIDRLEACLTGARPNEHARALGLDWL